MEDKILNLSLDIFNGDIDLMFTVLQRKGYPKWSFNGDLYLYNSDISDLKNLTLIKGYLNLRYCKNLTSLGNLEYVGGYFSLALCKNLISLGNLKYVGGNLYLYGSKISEIYSDNEIRQMVEINGRIIRDNY